MVDSPSLIVLDTSVVSIIYNQDSRALFYERRIAGQRPVVSFQTLEEIYCWPLMNGWGDRRRDELMRYLDQHEVIWPNRSLVSISAQLRTERRKVGHTLNTADAWIAATAIMLSCPLASHDGDFSDIPRLKLIQSPNP